MLCPGHRSANFDGALRGAQSSCARRFGSSNRSTDSTPSGAKYLATRSAESHVCKKSQYSARRAITPTLALEPLSPLRATGNVVQVSSVAGGGGVGRFCTLWSRNTCILWRYCGGANGSRQ